MNYQVYVTRGVVVRWLKPVIGVPLQEGRVGEARVFGRALPGDRYLLWATEETILAAVAASPKDASAKIAHEARKEGEPLPALLESLSGCSSESGAWSDTKVVIVGDEPQLADDRTVGVVSDGNSKVTKVKAKEVVNVEP